MGGTQKKGLEVLPSKFSLFPEGFIFQAEKQVFVVRKGQLRSTL